MELHPVPLAWISFLKVFHVLFVFLWIGTLLSITRLLGYHAREPVDVQMRLGKIYKKMYLFIDLPSMLFAITMGALLLFLKGGDWKAGWLHMKLTFAFFLIVCDAITGWEILRVCRRPAVGKGGGFRLLHAATILCLIGLLLSIYVVQKKNLSEESLQAGHSAFTQVSLIERR